MEKPDIMQLCAAAATEQNYVAFVLLLLAGDMSAAQNAPQNYFLWILCSYG